LFAYGPADATAIPKCHHLLPRLNPDWFHLSGTGSTRLSWKRGRQTGVVVVVVVVVVIDIVNWFHFFQLIEITLPQITMSERKHFQKNPVM